MLTWSCNHECCYEFGEGVAVVLWLSACGFFNDLLVSVQGSGARSHSCQPKHRAVSCSTGHKTIQRCTNHLGV